MLSENKDKLKEAIQICRMHIERMNFAHKQIAPLFPLTVQKYTDINPETLSFIDQFIYRFTKLQDCMGSKLFKAVLDNLGEEVRGVPVIDILARLEDLDIIDSTEDWFVLREVRNVLAHEYPFYTEEIIEGLNLLFDNYTLIIAVWSKLEAFIAYKFPEIAAETRL